MSSHAASFGWLAIARLGLVQAMLGAVVVLTTSTLNRVMVVELALPALLPGLLVALHYAVQLSRPRMGYGSDVGGRRTPWILGGMVLLAIGGFGAAVATTWMAADATLGIALAVLSFALVGVGVSAGGTSLLVLLAKRVDAPQRASAAALVWVMMIAGFAVTAGLAGRFLDPYSPERLMAVSGVVSLVAVVQQRQPKPGPTSRPRCARSGVSRTHATSPSSSSSRCWPTACKTSSSSPLPARCSATRRAPRHSWRVCSTAAP